MFATRGRWVSSWGRRQTINERLRLMGMNPNWINHDMYSSCQLGMLIHNSISVNVLERIILRVLSSIDLIPEKYMKNWETARLAMNRIKCMFWWCRLVAPTNTQSWRKGRIFHSDANLGATAGLSILTQIMAQRPNKAYVCWWAQPNDVIRTCIWCGS